MRTKQDARSNWDAFAKTPAHLLRERYLSDPQSRTGIRSALWKRALLFKTNQPKDWLRTLRENRGYYQHVKAKSVQHLNNADGSEVFVDPLSEDPNSQWETLQNDETLRQEIMQDVERCMPDNLYFRRPEAQIMLLDVLFVWSKLHVDTSYRQGMHEILATILWAVEGDAVVPSSIVKRETSDPDVVEEMFDADQVEADCFALFSAVMTGVASAYESKARPQRSTGQTISQTALESPMVVRGRRIQEEYLSELDPELSQHLMKIELLPQVFLMRWLRLLFCREFEFDEVLQLWDALFVRDSTMQCVDMMCAALLLRLRWLLLDSDNNEALSILVKQPPPSEHTPGSLVDDAIYLRSHLNVEGGRRVIEKRTGRSPDVAEGVASLGGAANGGGGASHASSPSRDAKSSGSLEGLLQQAARGVYLRGEKLGVNRTVREAVREVKKNVRDLQATRMGHSRGASYASVSEDNALERQANEFEERCKALAKQLELAVTHLWQQHEAFADGQTRDSEAVEKLAMGIARVQLAQVYLEDPSLPLPLFEEIQESENVSKASQERLAEEADLQDTDKRVSTVASTRAPDAAENDEPIDTDVHKLRKEKGSPVPSNTVPRHRHKESSTRPSLTQPSFSWMLGQNEGSARSAFMSASPFTDSPERPERRSHGFLFGDESKDSIAPPKAGSTARKPAKVVHEKTKEESKKIPTVKEEFDLGSI